MTRVSRREALKSFAAGGAALVVAACAPAAPSGSTGGAAAAPKPGGELRAFVQSGGVVDWDPAKAITVVINQRQSLVFEGLTQLTPTGAVEPLLAESWTVSNDRKVITFKLRNGVKFHNGRTMTAKDVEYTFSRIKDPKKAYVRAQAYAPIQSVKATDASTVEMTLTAPNPAILAVIADITGAILPQEAAEGPDFNDKPVGTGPFKMVGFTPPDEARFAKNPDYWRPGRPYLDKFTLMTSGDEAANLASFRSGQADVIFRPQIVEYDVIAKDTRFATYGADVYQGFFLHMAMNPAFKPFSDVKVRQAIFFGIDRDAVAKGALPGLTAPLYGGFYPSTHAVGLKESLYGKPDIAKAKQLLADAGYASGFKFEILARSTIRHFQLAAEILAEQLKALGLTPTITALPDGGNARVKSGQFESTVTAGSPSPEPNLGFADVVFKDGTFNPPRYEDPQVVALVRRAQASGDEQERVSLYQQAQRIMAQQGTSAWLYDYRSFDLAYRYVKGYIHPGVSGRWTSMQDVWLDK